MMKKLVCVVFLLVPLSCGALAQNGNPMQCYKCNSEEDQCVQMKFISPILCKDRNDQCITAIVDGVTYRGCKKEVNVPANSTSETCGFYRCNYKLFPKDRLKCYQCAGSSCRFTDPDMLKPCNNYVKEDSCVTDVIDDRNVIRGCMSDSNYFPSPFAEICQGYGCNNHPYRYSAECMSCAEANTTTCVRMSPPPPVGSACKVTNSNTCRSIALLNRPIKCFIYKASHQVVRGCPQNAGKLAEDINNYRLCERELCNNDCIDIRCIKCDSRMHSKCINQASELEPELCPNDMACFVAQTAEGAIIRGCGDKLAGTNQNSTACYEDGCNHEIPSDFCKGDNCNASTYLRKLTSPLLSIQ